MLLWFNMHQQTDLAIFPHEVLLNQLCASFQLWHLLVKRRNGVSHFCKSNITFISVKLYKDQLIASSSSLNKLIQWKVEKIIQQ